MFTEYRDTLQHVLEVVAASQGSARFIATLHGGMTAAERAREARRFTHGDARILLATDAASEGLNLHHRCRLVINLEMPWTPLRLEQRIGRVDRLGQERRVHAVGLVGRDTAEESVVASLTARAASARREAPFGDATLRQEAEAEAARLGTCRALARNIRTDVKASGRRCDRRSPRPVVSVLTKRRSRAYAAVRLSFVDASGFELWDTIIGARVALTATNPPSSVASIAALHKLICRRLRDDLRASVAPLIAREEAMLQALQSRRGRLASPLVQAGLFDRRALRDAEAQQRIADEAVLAASERVVALRRLLDAASGAQRLVFAVVA